MASSTVEKMPQTVEAFMNLAQRDLELIEAQAAEIANLTCKLNKRDQKIARLERVIGKLTHQLAAKKKEKAVFQSVDELNESNPITNGE